MYPLKIIHQDFNNPEVLMPFYMPQNRATKTIAPGIHIRSWWGDQSTVLFVELEPNAELSSHSHPHEQSGVILTGEVEFNIGGEKRLLAAGDIYLIPGNTLHEVRNGNETTTLFEVFAPVREELKY